MSGSTAPRFVFLTAGVGVSPNPRTGSCLGTAIGRPAETFDSYIHTIGGINTSNPTEMMVNILTMCDPPGVPQAPLLDQGFPQRLEAALRLARPLPFLALTVSQLAQILAGLGLRIQPLYLQEIGRAHV